VLPHAQQTIAMNNCAHWARQTDWYLTAKLCSRGVPWAEHHNAAAHYKISNLENFVHINSLNDIWNTKACCRYTVYSREWLEIQEIRDGHQTLNLVTETETLNSRDRDETETLALPAETRSRRDVGTSLDVTETFVHVVLIAVVQLFFTFITCWRGNVIINYRLRTSNSIHISTPVCYVRTSKGWERDVEARDRDEHFCIIGNRNEYSSIVYNLLT